MARAGALVRIRVRVRVRVVRVRVRVRVRVSGALKPRPLGAAPPSFAPPG